MSSTTYQMSLRNEWYFGGKNLNLMNACVCHVTDGKYNGFFVFTLNYGTTTTSTFDCEVVSGERDYWTVFFIDSNNTMWGVMNTKITLPYGESPNTPILVVVDGADLAVQVYFGNKLKGSGTLINLGVYNASTAAPVVHAVAS